MQPSPSADTRNALPRSVLEGSVLEGRVLAGSVREGGVREGEVTMMQAPLSLLLEAPRPGGGRARKAADPRQQDFQRIADPGPRDEIVMLDALGGRQERHAAASQRPARRGL